jgi:hypothetical protein
MNRDPQHDSVIYESPLLAPLNTCVLDLTLYRMHLRGKPVSLATVEIGAQGLANAWAESRTDQYAWAGIT